MGGVREQTQSQVLSTHCRRKTQIPERNGEVESHGGCDRGNLANSAGGSMRLWRRSWNWLRDVCRLSRVENEMDVELRCHLEAYAHDLIRAGMSPAEARRRARIDFGSFEQTKDDCRNARGINVVETVSQDLRYALRIQRRSWSFAAVTVPTLALGIGTAAAIFSVVKAVIFNPLPFRE